MEVPSVRCPKCDTALGAAVGYNHNNAPRPGGLVLCAYCGALSLMLEGYQLRAITDDEEMRLPEAARKQVEGARQAISRAHLASSRSRPSGN